MKSLFIFLCFASTVAHAQSLAESFAKDRAGIVAEMRAALQRNAQFRSATDAGEKYQSVADPEVLALWQKVVTAQSVAMAKVANKLDSDATKTAKKRGIGIGMSREQVLASVWGKPQQVNTTTNAYGTHEQWVYGRSYLYFDNDRLTSIQN